MIKEFPKAKAAIKLYCQANIDDAAEIIKLYAALPYEQKLIMYGRMTAHLEANIARQTTDDSAPDASSSARVNEAIL